MIPLKLSQALQGFFLNAQARRLSPHTIEDYQNTLVVKFQPFLRAYVFGKGAKDAMCLFRQERTRHYGDI